MSSLNGQHVANQRLNRAGHAGQGSVIQNNAEMLLDTNKDRQNPKKHIMTSFN